MGIVDTPTQCDIEIFQGATFKKVWQWIRDGEPVDLTGATVRGMIRHQYGRPALATLTCQGGAAGHVKAVLDANTTRQLIPVECVWDLEVAWPDGDVCRLLMGKCLISPQVTR